MRLTKANYLWGIVLSETVAIVHICVCVYWHPKATFFDCTSAAEDLAYYVPKSLKLFRRNNWQVVHHNSVGKAYFNLWKVLILKYLIIIITASYNQSAI